MQYPYFQSFTGNSFTGRMPPVYFGISGEFFQVDDTMIRNSLNQIGTDLYSSVAIIPIDSNGGSVSTFRGIGDYLKALKDSSITTVTYNEGCVGSSAILPYSAGMLRIAHPDSKFFFHPVKVEGDFSRTGYGDQELYLLTQRVTFALADFIVENTNVSREEILELYKTDNELSAQEAKKLGLVDDIRVLSLPDQRPLIAAGQTGYFWLYSNHKN